MSAFSPQAPASPRLFGQRGESSKRHDERGLLSGPAPAQSATRRATHRIHSVLAPRIAVINSPDVDDLLAVNNIDSLADFLRPFEDAADNISVRTSQLETRQCPTFPMQFDDLDAFYPAPANAASTSDSTLFTPADLVSAEDEKGKGPETPQRVRRKRRRQDATAYARPEVLLDAISARIRAKSRALWALQGNEKIQEEPARRGHRRGSSKAYQVDDGLGFSANSSASIQDLRPGQGRPVQDEIDRYRRAPVEEVTPWFTDMRDMVLQERAVSEHETFNHPVAVIMAVSSSSPDPLNAFTKLYEASQATTCPAFSQRPYIDPLVFRYYLLIHDTAKAGPDLADSIALLDTVKKTYGIHCCLLQLNSAGSSQADGTAALRSNDLSKLWSKTHNGRRFREYKDAENTLATPPRNGRVNEAQDESVDSQLSLAWHGEEQNGDAETFGSLLDDNDVRRIRTFVRDFAAQSLIPFMERCVSLWNEQLAASRKGLTNRLFGAGRKLFGGSRGTQSQTAASFSSLGYYPHASLEAQTRRLADFAFTTRDYRLAAAMYDYGRRDYLNDKAYRFSAGANEMFGLSHLMMMLNNQSALIDVDSYLATAVHDYMLAPRQTGSALQLDGLRSTLLYYECYQALNYYRSAPTALVRTAGQGASESAMDDLEVVAAMLLEQAALSSLRQPLRPSLRKCALHLVMAAHKYGSCGQKHLSLRSFHSAAFCYSLLRKSRYELDTEVQIASKDDDGESEAQHRLADESKLSSTLQSWKYVDDHMELELAQQAYNDGRTSEAVRHYLLLLQQQRSRDDLASREEDALRHEVYLSGFLTCSRFLEKGFPASLEPLDIPPSLHLVDVAQTRIGVNAVQHLDDGEWRALQIQALGQLAKKESQQSNTTAIHEPFCVYVHLRNPLSVAMTIRGLSLVFVDGATGDAIRKDTLKVEKIEEVVLEAREERMVVVGVTSAEARSMRCASVTYSLTDTASFCEDLDKHGRRLNDTKQQRASSSPQYDQNPTVTVQVRESDASMHASFPHAITHLALGEEVRRSVVLKNAGRNILRNLRAYASPSDAILSTHDSTEARGRIEMNDTLARPAPLEISLPGDQFEAQSSVDWQVTLRGQSLGSTTVRVLIVYETMSGDVFSTQVQHTLRVGPVLDMSVEAVPTSSVTDVEYDLRLFATSLLDGPNSVTISSVTILAPLWALPPVHIESSLFDDVRFGETRQEVLRLNMDSNEKAQSTTQSLTPTLERLKALLRGKSLDSVSPPLPATRSLCVSDSRTDTASLSPFYMRARRQHRLAALRSEFSALSDRLVQLFPSYEPDDVDIVINWRINGTERRGQSFIFGFHVGPLHDLIGKAFSRADSDSASRPTTTRTMYAETDREQALLATQVLSSRLAMENDPITLEFEVPPEVVVEEPFSIEEGSHQTIAVQLLVKNLSAVRTRSVVLQLENHLPAQVQTSSSLSRRDATSESQISQQQPALASFINRLTLRATLAPYEQATLSAQARVSRSGLHVLAPVLVKSFPERSTRPSVPWHEFQRWEHCPTTIDVRSP